MKYRSTRSISEYDNTVSSAEAIKTGLAPDGGLYMPTDIPRLMSDDIKRLRDMSYFERAAYILSMYLTDYDREMLSADCMEAYSEKRFPGGAAPLKKLYGNNYLLELWHGPTCAFKDMALQIMPRLLSRALTMTGETRKARILVATSGDTGKAALEGYKNIDGIDINVFFPDDGVSKMQKLQMMTQEGENVYVCAVKGNFDDTQNGVKRIFSDAKLASISNENGFFFSSANSINWGRLAPQIVYYISAYCDLTLNGTIKDGEKINICVPTGNFGNIFAAFIAKQMGLPISKLICASNSNCVLTDFIKTGVYDKTREFFKTMSPSMDILISSNLERLLYLTGGSSLTAELMNQLADTGRYKMPVPLHNRITETFEGYYCNEEETAETIRNTFKNYGYLADPHTSVGIGCLEKYVRDSGDDKVTVVASTASPYKFAANVCSSIGIYLESNEPEYILSKLSSDTGTDIPVPLMRTLNLPVRFTDVISIKDMPQIALRK